MREKLIAAAIVATCLFLSGCAMLPSIINSITSNNITFTTNMSIGASQAIPAAPAADVYYVPDSTLLKNSDSSLNRFIRLNSLLGISSPAGIVYSVNFHFLPSHA